MKTQQKRSFLSILFDTETHKNERAIVLATLVLVTLCTLCAAIIQLSN